MNMAETIIAVIHLPRNFNNLGDVSAYSLLLDSGYCETHNQITESAIHEELIKRPECVGEWLNFSEEKRTSTGWYFQKGSKSYQVGYFPNGQLVDYVDKITACAAFIKREIENIRTEGKEPRMDSTRQP
jgi:hypothetical protein